MSTESPAPPDRSNGSGRTELATVAKGAGFLAAGRVFSMAVRLVMAVMLARWLGADDYGLYILAISIAFSASALGSFGLDTGMERYVAVETGRDDGGALRGALQVGIAGTLAGSLVMAGVIVLLRDTLANDLFDEPDLVPLLTITALLVPLLAMSTFGFATLIGFKRMGHGAIARDVVQPLARLVLLGAVWIAGATAFRAGMAIAVSYLAACVIAYRLVMRAVDSTSPGPIRREVRDIAAFSLPFWFTGVLRIARTRLQPVLLGVVGTTANVGIFSVITSASLLGRAATLSINKALRPTVAQLHDAGDHAEIGRLYATTTRWTLAVNLPIVLVIALLPESILGVFGPNFTTGTSALVVVVLAELAGAATGMSGPIIAMSGHNRLKVINSFVWMAVSIAANVILIPIWGLMGAAVAVVISTSSINIIRVVEIWVLYRVLPWDRHIWKPLSAGVTAASALVLVRAATDGPLSPLALAATAIGVAGLFLAVVAILGFEEDDQDIIDRLRAKFSLRVRGR
ncbi:MAG: flippase [Actinomycetota bacterium]